MSESSTSKWLLAPIDVATEIVRGVSYKKGDARDTPGKNYIPILRANNIQNGKLILDELVYVPKENVKENQLINKGDIVVAMSSGSKKLVGKSGLSTEKQNAAFGTFCGVLRPNSNLNSKYIGLFTRSKEYLDKVSSLSKGVNINNLKPSHFSEINIPIAPLNEQIRIANKLDSLLAKIDAAQAHLEQIPTLLKRFRQSVLAAATSGELTREWREGHPVDDVKEIEWQWLTIEDLIKGGPQNGIYKPAKLYGDGTKIIRIDGFYDGVVKNWSTFKRVILDKKEIDSWGLKVNDILINRVNSMEYLGKCGLVRYFPEPIVFESNIMRITPNSKVIPEYLIYFLTSPKGILELRKNAKHAVNQASINQTDVKTIQVELPKLVEQKEIVRRVESLFALADLVEKQYLEAKQRVDRLTQSLLAKAFRGELVPQDPNDEPASELLKRIQAEREALASIKPARKVRSKKRPA